MRTYKQTELKFTRFSLMIILATVLLTGFASISYSRSTFVAAQNFSMLPLQFELNRNQIDMRVQFLSHGNGYSFFFLPTEVVFVFRHPTESNLGQALRMKLLDSNRVPLVTGLDELAGKSNYFAGNNPQKWYKNIPNYAKVKYENVYPGIDLIYYGNQKSLEYDFIVAPGADPNCIHLEFQGMDDFDLDNQGNLILRTAARNLTFQAPTIFQRINGRKQFVSGSYIQRGKHQLGFQIGEYDQHFPLIIDPVLSYSTYLGGTGFDNGNAIAVDAGGNAYVTGQTATADFPTTIGAFQQTYGGGDAFITKINPTGTALVYSTYIHGATAYGIAVDSSGNSYITGEALSLNFPTTPGAFQTPPYAFDTFITKLNTTGSALVYSSRFGSDFDDFGRDIAVDALGNAYITGWTKCAAPTCNFPTVNAFQPNYGGGNNDAFVTKINANGSALVYSTYLGGGTILNTTDDWGDGIAVDSSGSAYVTGYTYSQDFPTTPGAYDTTNNNSLDTFVTKFTPAGSALVYSTFLGGYGRDQGLDIAVNANGNAYITGLTESEDNPFTAGYEGFPVTAGAFQTSGSFDAFVTKLNALGSGLVYSTYLGGSNDVDRGWGIALDNAGNAYITGDTKSTNFPVANAPQTTYGGGLNDAFVTKLDAAGSTLLYSTFLGGVLDDEGRSIAVDTNADAYVAGFTSSFNFPVTAGVFQPDNAGGLEHHDDAFIAKITDISSGIAAPSNLVATAVSSSQINLTWVDNSNNESSFRIERCQGSTCTNFVQIATVTANVTNYANTGLAASTIYRYRVRAYNGDYSPYSNIAAATTQPAGGVPAAPTGLSAKPVSATQINLQWSDNSGNETGFKIERCQGVGCTNFQQISTVGANIMTFNNTGLNRKKTYRYRVRAYNASGNSPYSNIATAKTSN